MDTSEVLIGLLEGDHVSLSNWRHESDGWVCADAEVRCGPWQGRLRVEFHPGELPRFAEEIERLYNELRGTAVLKPIEPYIELELSGNGRGGIEVKGIARSQFEVQSWLSFHFAIEQTFLPRIAAGLRAHGAR